MKNTFLLVFIFVICLTDFLHTQTDNWRIVSLNRELFSINFLNQNKAMIFAGDMSYKSLDGGVTWSTPIRMNTIIGLTGGSGFNYPDYVYFIDSSVGWSCQNSDVLLKTVNGGQYWYPVITNLEQNRFGCIQFLNSQTGWAAGTYNIYYGGVIKTTNGGTNWIPLNYTIRGRVRSFHMVNNNKGFATYTTNSGYGPDTLAVTEDGWSSVQYIKAGSGNVFGKRVLFIDELHGWLLGPGYISRTVDGGTVWNVHTYNIGINSLNFFFLDSNIGWMIGTHGTVAKTSNGGINWIRVREIQGASPYDDLYDVFFKNANTGWITSYNGTLLKSTNGGLNYFNNIAPPLGNISSMDFCNTSTGWIIANYNGYKVWKSTNRGYNWSITFSSPGVALNSLDFCNENTGYICGNSGTIMKTTDGGSNWFNLDYSSNQYRSVCFLNSETGYVCGSDGVIVKTDNGGVNWTEQNSHLIWNLNDIYFTDILNGFVAADKGYVITTSNGGLDWNVRTPYNDKDYSSIHFVNSSTGFAVGQKYISNPFGGTSYVVIVKTINGGLSWTHPYEEGLYGFCTFTDVQFLNEQTGWVVGGRYDNPGSILKTTNGGAIWYGTQNPANYGLDHIKIINEDFGWICGAYGTILTISPIVGIQNIGNYLPFNFSLSQNYPNPFNPQTKIRLDVPRASFTKLVIYDLLGREVATLVDEELKPGSYEADWDASNFSSGVYFYKIIAGDFVETKKMVLMK